MSEDNNKKWYQEDEIFNEKGQHIALWWLIHDKETDNITSILIMEDDIKLQSIELFSELLKDEELFELFKKRKIKECSIFSISQIHI